MQDASITRSKPQATLYRTARDLSLALPEMMDREYASGLDFGTAIVSVSCDDFIIMCVPRGAEKNVAMVLNR